MRRRDVAVLGRRHLVLGGEVDPELEAGHAARLLLGHFGVDDAAPGGHPLHAAGLEQADVADAVAVAHAPVEHDRHGLEAAVRVVGKAADVVARGIAAEGVEHQERIEAALQRLRQHARQLDAGAVGGRLAADDALDAARDEGGCGGGMVMAPSLRRYGARRRQQTLRRNRGPRSNAGLRNPHPRRIAHEALLQPRRLFPFPAHRAARIGPCVRAGAGEHQDPQAAGRHRLLHDQSEGLRAAARARQRRAPERRPGDRAVHRRPGAGEEAGAGQRHDGALSPAGVAQLHHQRAAQGLRPACSTRRCPKKRRA